MYLFSGGGAWVTGIAFAGSSGWQPPVLTASGSADLILRGDQFLEPGDLLVNRFGTALAVLGDVVPGVGGLEFAVGAPQEKALVNGMLVETGPGRVHVFSGDGAEQVRLLGGQIGERYGATLDASVNYDADPRPELIVGAMNYDHETSPGSFDMYSGRVWVLDGFNFAPVVAFFDSQINNTGLIGPPGSFFGFSVKGVEDMVGSPVGQPDLLVGAKDEFSIVVDPLISGCAITQGGRIAGAAYIIDGATGDMRYKLIGERARDHVGFDVSALDYDGDGLMDLLTGGMAWTNPADESAQCNTKIEVGRVYIRLASSLP